MYADRHKRAGRYHLQSHCNLDFCRVLGPVDEQTNSEANDDDEDESATKAVEEKWILVERRGNEKKERSMSAHSKENTLT